MINVFITRDIDPDGGFFAVYEQAIVPSEQPLSVREIRKGTFPEETLQAIYRGEVVAEAPSYYDEYIIPHWETATVWWTREGGFVSGSE